MAQFAQGCSDKHGREMKMTDINPAEEGDFPYKPSFDDWVHQNGNLMVSKIVIILLI